MQKQAIVFSIHCLLVLQIFVYGNNIYYQEALGKDIVQLTDTGEDMNIFNGVPDWVYEGM